MIVGVPKEIKNKENRVGMVIAGVRALTAAGHKVLIQHNAGVGAGISNDDYRKAGATIIETREGNFRQGRHDREGQGASAGRVRPPSRRPDPLHLSPSRGR